MKVSIIVPVYNAEKTLKRCIESVLNQTSQLWELILVDDGSKDSSLEICNSYASTDGRIKVVHKENGGVSSARNLGIDFSSGEWLSFLDSDDFLAENAVQSCIDYSVRSHSVRSHSVRSHNVSSNENVCNDIIYFDARILYPTSEQEYHSVSWNEDKVKFLQSYIPSLWTSLCFMFIRREFVISESLKLNPEISYCEDFLFTVQAFMKAKNWVYCNRALYIYDQRNTVSATHSRPKKHFSDEMRAYEIISEKMKKDGIYPSLKQQLDWRKLNCRMLALYHNPECLSLVDLSDVDLENIWSNPFWGLNHKIIMWFDAHKMDPIAKGILKSQSIIKKVLKR